MAKSKMYIYRAEMRKNGKEEPTTVYLYARNAKCAKAFCQTNFEKFDNFQCTKFATTSTVSPSINASFIDDGEMDLIKANIAGHGEIFAERDPDPEEEVSSD